MQVRVLTNLSDPFPEKIVRERLDGAIRTLRFAIAAVCFIGANVCFLSDHVQRQEMV